MGRQGNFVLLEYSYNQQSDLVIMDVLCVPDRTGSSKLVISATIQIIFTITDKLADKKSPTPSLAHDVYLFAYPDDATREMASLGLTATTPSHPSRTSCCFLDFWVWFGICIGADTRWGWRQVGVVGSSCSMLVGAMPGALWRLGWRGSCRLLRVNLAGALLSPGWVKMSLNALAPSYS